MLIIMKKNSGFAMLEVLLALVILAIGVTGVYFLYQRIQASVKSDQVRNQIITLVTNFSALSSLRLTQDLKQGSDLINLFYSSNKLPDNYFNKSDQGSIQIVNPYGVLNFSNVSSNAFTMLVPVGSADAGQQIDMCNQVQSYIPTCTTNQGENKKFIQFTVTAGN